MDLIDRTEGNATDKSRIYNSMGNISDAESKIHQANYYYSKAAAIVMKDTALDLPPSAKVTILLSAAQSNEGLHQYDLAQHMNLAALKLTPLLPETDINQQRVLVQLVNNHFKSDNDTAAMLRYITRLELLNRRNPAAYNATYLNGAKVNYYQATKQEDSLLQYELLQYKIDEENYRRHSSLTFAGNVLSSGGNVMQQYALTGHLARAKYFLQKIDALYKKYSSVLPASRVIMYHSQRAEYFKNAGDVKASLNELERAYDLQRKTFEAENTQAIAEMNTLYELQAKDNSIKALSRNIELRTLQLERNRLLLILTVLAFLVLAICTGLFYSIYRQRKLRQEKEKVVLQQQLLRTQMEPHFIFNTLAVLQSFIRMNKTEAAINYIGQFSRLLRSTLELSREQTVSLSDEVDMLENYLSLQQVRYEQGFEYRIDMPANLNAENLMLPPMLIQPFVENAIMHGIATDEEKGFVHIGFALQDNIMQVNISDSGRPSTAGSNSAGHKSLSGAISRERMQLLGKYASIHTTTNSHGGTTLRLDIPV
jgi:hypothetical protein